MEFNTVQFVICFLVLAFINQILSVKIRKYYILFISCICYFFLDSKFFLLLVFAVLGSYVSAKVVSIQKNARLRKFTLCISILMVCSILVLFKYYNFFTDGRTDAIKLIMPLGISYYSFKIISYLIDTYKKSELTCTSLVNYAVYISFFPQIICGPITRAYEILKFIDTENKMSAARIKDALYKITSGLFKKIVIADRLNIYVNTVFANWEGYPALALWLATLFYAVQLYCDFAGYSEIIIGITELFGFQCRENFQTPYFSHSINEFWRRWHISLSTWLRDYIYIPLGGNRVYRWRQKLNVLVVFLVSGIWHGNNLNYIIWGLWHGVLSICSPKKAEKFWMNIFQTVMTFCCVMFGWILFKTDSVWQTIAFIGKMFMGVAINMNVIISSVMPFTGDYACLAYMLTVCIFILILFVMEWKDFNHHSNNRSARLIFFLLSIAFFGTMGSNSFLYANF